MADFSKPVPTDLNADILTNIRNIVDSLAKMQDGTTDTNIASGYIRYSSTNKRFEKYNGTSWAAVEISNLAANAVTTTSMAANAADDTKIRLRNNNALRSLNAAGNADISALYVDNNDNTFLNAAAGKAVVLSVNGVTSFGADVSKLYPGGASDSKDIGSATLRVANAYLRYLQNVEQVNATSANLEVGPTSAHELRLKTTNTVRWNVATTGHLYPNAADSYDIGGPANQQARVVYAGKFISKDGADAQFFAPTGQAALFGADGAQKWRINIFGTFYPIAAYDLGGPANAVANLFANVIKSGTTSDLQLVPPASRALGLGSNNGLKWTVDINGHFDPLLDASYDLGLSATRIRNAYIGRVDFGVTGSTAYITGNADRLRLGSPVTGSAGAIVEYMTIERPDGTQRKLALYAVS